MKVWSAAAGLLWLTCCLPVTLSQDSSLLEDMEGSSDDVEFSDSGDWMDSETETKIVHQRTMWPPDGSQPDNLDYSGDGRLRGERSKNSISGFGLKDQNKITRCLETKDLGSRKINNADMSWPETQKNKGLMDRTEILTGVVAAGLVALLMAIMMVSFMVYKLRKKDEGSYDIGSPNEKYQKPQKTKEFFV